MRTPFQFKTPDNLTAEEFIELYVNIFSDSVRLTDPGHTFIDGARGTGKSMLLRYMEPDVQLKIHKHKKFAALDFWAVHIPIRMPCFSLRELEIYEGFPYYAVTEHMLISYILVRMMSKLIEMEKYYTVSEKALNDVKKSFRKIFIRSGCTEEDINFIGDQNNIIDLLNESIEYIETIGSKISRYINGARTNPKNYTNYDLPLFRFYDALYPLCKDMKKWDWMPSQTIFIMLDDADWLPDRMQKIINTWVASRTNEDVCFKIATQLQYKQYRTVDDKLILEPHDFNRIELGTIYTAQKTSYSNKIRDVIRKRLKLSNVEIKPDDYFPENAKQKQAIEEQKNILKQEFNDGTSKHKSNTIGDHIARYAVSNYMKSIAGHSKNLHNYNYSGIDTIINISDGSVRTFLEFADNMFSEQKTQTSGNEVKYIDPRVQNKILKQQAEDMFRRGPGAAFGVVSAPEDESIHPKDKLRKLINSLGGLFHKILLSEASERKVISITIEDIMPSDIKLLFEAGIEIGYFYESTIGSKRGAGRSTQYILTKRLAPFFLLDPSGYAGYKKVTAEQLKIAVENTDKFITTVLKEQPNTANLFVKDNDYNNYENR